jgi:hypothetical protein
MLAEAGDPCAPGRALRISQGECNRILLASTLLVFSNAGLAGVYRRLELAVRRLLPVPGE